MLTEKVSQRPLVVPVQLPWSISTSVSNLQVSIGENKDCLVRCDAFFGNHREDAQYQRIEIVFDAAICCRMVAFRSDANMPGEKEYDWTKIYVRPKTEDELENQMKSQAEIWRLTNFCPNPHFFEIERSPWAADYQNQFVHFLLIGTDSYVEVLALSFRWSPIYVLDQ